MLRFALALGLLVWVGAPAAEVSPTWRLPEFDARGLQPGLAVPFAVPSLLEFEELHSQVIVSAGSVDVQDMQGFGSQWSAGAQLFWRAPAPVHTPLRDWPNLRVSPEVPKPGRYRVSLVYTVAPDYGVVRVFVQGQPVRDLDGYAPAVGVRRVQLGDFQLQGRIPLVFTVFDRAPPSQGHFVGLDRLELLSLD